VALVLALERQTSHNLALQNVSMVAPFGPLATDDY
jgi:hypothetical protein